MALDITLQITADASQAKAELSKVEQQIKQVENANKSSAQWWQKEEQAIDKTTGTLTTHRGELSKVEAGMAKMTSATAAAATTSEKLGSVTVNTSSALTGLSGGAEGVAAKLLAFSGATEMSVGSLIAMTGGIGALLGVFAAFVGILATSAEYYIEHGKGAKGLRDEWTHLQETWEKMQLVIGEAVVGGAQSPLILFMHLAEDAAVEWAVKLAIVARTLWDIAMKIPVVGTMLSGLDGTAPDDDPTKNYTARMRAGFGGRGDVYLPGGGGDVDLSSHNYIDTDLDPTQALSFDAGYRDIARREAAKRAQTRAAIQRLLDSGIGYHVGLGSMPGTRGDVGLGGLLDVNIPNLPYHLGLGSAPGMQYDVSIPNVNQGFFRGAFGSNFGGGLSSSILGALMGGGNPFTSAAGFAGSSIFGSLAKTITSGDGLNIGGFFGGVLNSVLPGVGGLIGPLLGKIFGPTQYQQQQRSANTDIAALWASMNKQYGGNADSALSIFGLDPAGLHGKNFQGAMGLDPLKGVFDELQKRQQQFNSDLGGTLGKIKELGGNIPEALKPYLEQLTSAKVLTQENIDLIAKMAGENTVDFDKMEEAAGRYGISIDALGQGFKEHKMHEGWQQIIDDLDLLQRGGADMNAVLGSEGMQKKISELVQQSIHFGTTIPENMRPFIQTLIESGKLLGDDGKAITDLDKLKFGDTMQTTLDNLNTTLRELIEALGVKVPDAAKKAGQAWRDNLDGLPMPGGSGPGGKTNPGPGGGTPNTPAALHFDMRGAVISSDAAMDTFVTKVGGVVANQLGTVQRFSAIR